MANPSDYSEALYAALSKLPKTDLLRVCVYLGAACTDTCDDLERGTLRAAQEAAVLGRAGILDKLVPIIIDETLQEKDEA
ncbi:MAG: hypothetical protein WC551_11570 [Patescibacteria group bacterium]